MSKVKGSSRSRELVAGIGATGSGKSTIGQLMLETRGPTSAFLVDRLARFPTSLSARFSERIFTDASALVKAVRERVDQQKPFRFSFAPANGAEPAAAGFVCKLAKWTSETGGIESWVALEEASNACAHGLCDPETIECARDGRHYGVSMLGLAQRPTGIDLNVMTELASGTLWLGRLVEDESRLRRRLKKHADRLPTLRTIKDETEAGRPPVSDWLRLGEGKADPEAWTLTFRGGQPFLELAHNPEVS